MLRAGQDSAALERLCRCAEQQAEVPAASACSSLFAGMLACLF